MLTAVLRTRGRMTPTDLENLRQAESEGVLQHLVAVRGRLYGLMDAATLQEDYRAAASIGNILGKLGIDTSPEDHRRVLAVLRMLGQHG